MDTDFPREDRDGRTTVRVTGDLDVISASRLRDLLVDLVEGGRTDLVVDLRSTEFVDSSGLSALVTGHKRAVAAGGTMVVVCPPGPVRRLIEVVSLDQVFSMRDDEPPL